MSVGIYIKENVYDVGENVFCAPEIPEKKLNWYYVNKKYKLKWAFFYISASWLKIEFIKYFYI